MSKPVIVTRDQLALLLGVGDRQCRDYIKRGMPRRTADPETFDAIECRQWQIQKIGKRASDSERPDPAELLKEEQYLMARNNRLKQEGRLADVEVLHAGLQDLAATIRSLGRDLERKFSPAAREILEHALDQVDARIDTLCGGGDE